MSIGSTNTQRTDTGTARVSPLSIPQPCIDVKGTTGKINLRIGFLEVQAGGINLCLRARTVLISPVSQQLHLMTDICFD